MAMAMARVMIDDDCVVMIVLRGHDCLRDGGPASHIVAGAASLCHNTHRNFKYFMNFSHKRCPSQPNKLCMLYRVNIIETITYTRHDDMLFSYLI